MQKEKKNLARNSYFCVIKKNVCDGLLNKLHSKGPETPTFHFSF